MKKKIILIFIGLSFLLSSLFATQGQSVWSGPGEVRNPDYIPRKPKVVKKEEPKKVEPKPEPKKEEPKKVESKPEPKKEEVKVEPKEEIVVEQKKKSSDEYERSVGGLNISKDTFENDKKAIMAMISELASIMEDKNYRKWLNYVDNASQTYWSKSVNLKKAQRRMPVKGLQLKTLEDYFKYIFVPARQKSKISEIRYESENLVKAVEVQAEQDLVYYYFKKTNGKWLIYIPPLD